MIAQELNEVRVANESLRRLNCGLEDQLISKRSAENVELVELRRTMLECEIELHELREQYLTLKAKAENDLNVEHKKIGKNLLILCSAALNSMLEAQEFEVLRTE